VVVGHVFPRFAPFFLPILLGDRGNLGYIMRRWRFRADPSLQSCRVEAIMDNRDHSPARSFSFSGDAAISFMSPRPIFAYPRELRTRADQQPIGPSWIYPHATCTSERAWRLPQIDLPAMPPDNWPASLPPRLQCSNGTRPLTVPCAGCSSAASRFCRPVMYARQTRACGRVL
jgi:hypothetical protein